MEIYVCVSDLAMFRIGGRDKIAQESTGVSANAC